jgi:hypothetical protein
MITIEQATIGTRVKTNVEFYDLPKGSVGKIAEDYGFGVMVEWEKEPRASWQKPLRDGFNKQSELQFLDLVP